MSQLQSDSYLLSHFMGPLISFIVYAGVGTCNNKTVTVYKLHCNHTHQEHLRCL